MDFSGKTVFITGGSRGIGKTIKETYRKLGASVIAPTRQEMDLSDEHSVEEYLQANSDISIDIFVFCAGINPVAPIEEIDIDDMEETFRVNLFSSIRIIKHYISDMKKKKAGKIVFITSLYSQVTREGRLPYTGSKHAVFGAVKTLALELAPYGICVNAVAPGYVMTDMTRQNLSASDINEICEKIPTRRFQTEEEIADAVLFLSGDSNKSITGQTIFVDGGFLCR